jgi:hypothetical protein
MKKKAPKTPIEFSAELARAMNVTWQQIAADLYECSPDLSNDEAIEACVDADRLLFNGESAEAHAEMKALCAEHGYHAVLDALSARFKFA